MGSPLYDLLFLEDRMFTSLQKFCGAAAVLALAGCAGGMSALPPGSGQAGTAPATIERKNVEVVDHAKHTVTLLIGADAVSTSATALHVLAGVRDITIPLSRTTTFSIGHTRLTEQERRAPAAVDPIGCNQFYSIKDSGVPSILGNNVVELSNASQDGVRAEYHFIISVPLTGLGDAVGPFGEPADIVAFAAAQSDLSHVQHHVYSGSAPLDEGFNWDLSPLFLNPGDLPICGTSSTGFIDNSFSSAAGAFIYTGLAFAQTDSQPPVNIGTRVAPNAVNCPAGRRCLQSNQYQVVGNDFSDIASPQQIATPPPPPPCDPNDPSSPCYNPSPCGRFGCIMGP